MNDVQRIHAVIARARRRIRLQGALDWGTVALVPGVTGALVVLWFWRMEYLSSAGALQILAAMGGAVVLAACAGMLKPLPWQHIAARIDRASNLDSRLGTACEFAETLSKTPGSVEEHPETRWLMEAAIRDGLAAASRADVKGAAPLRLPRDARTALSFAVVGAMVVCLAFAPDRDLGGVFPGRSDAAARRNSPDSADAEKALDEDDLEYPRELLEDMHRVAEQTDDTHLREFAKALEELLDKADKGELTKEQMLAEMEKLEKKYMEGTGDDAGDMVEALKDAGKELKKEPLTKELGEALEAGDAAKAKEALQKLADKIDKGELSEQEQQRLAESLDKAQKQLDAKQQREDKAAQKQIDKQKEAVRRLEKKLAEKPQDQELKRRLEKEKRELAKLERDQKERQEQREKRQLARLSRNLRDSAENLRNRKPQASQNLRDSAEDTQRVEDEIRKIQNQQKTQSQLADLKEALRRAKQGKGRGNDRGRASRIRDFERRAGGQKGNATAWKPGQGRPGDGPKGTQGNRGQGQDPNGPPGNGAGDQHDPNLTADPTQHYGKTKDEELTGQHGRGPSARETILTSAQKGFAGASYKRVYANYKKVIENVMSQEKVPQGYKYYVKRYFQRIKPHDME